MDILFPTLNNKRRLGFTQSILQCKKKPCFSQGFFKQSPNVGVDYSGGSRSVNGPDQSSGCMVSSE